MSAVSTNAIPPLRSIDENPTLNLEQCIVAKVAGKNPQEL
jgi:hypothetical protein